MNGGGEGGGIKGIEKNTKEYKLIQWKEQIATALLRLTKLSVCLFYYIQVGKVVQVVKEGKQRSIWREKVKDEIGKTEREIVL